MPSQPRRQAIAATIAAGMFFALGASSTFAQTAWPSKPLKMVVGFPAGSSPDLTARLLAEPLSQALGQPVIVENKAGAGGNIGADAVARATDDHTIGLMINGNLTIAKILNPATTYDPLKDLQPVSLIAVSPLVLAAPAGAPVGKAFFDQAKAQGDKLNYGTPGVGTVAHLAWNCSRPRPALRRCTCPTRATRR